MKPITEQDFLMEKKAVDAIANQTIKTLLSQPRETIYIPSQHEQDVRWEGNINGVRIHIKKNAYVQVPAAVAEVVRNNTKVLEESAKKAEKYTAKAGPKIAEM